MEIKPSRVKSSRQSNLKPSSGQGDRAVTPKSQNKLYASAGINKDSRTGKINHSTLNINRMGANPVSNDYLMKTSMNKLNGNTQQFGGMSSMLT